MYKYNKRWTKEEVNYLENSWGTTSIETISKKLNRSFDGILEKAKRLKLGGCYASTEYLNVNDIANTLKVDNHTIVDYWIGKCGLKAKKKRLIQLEQWFINPNDLIHWLENNKDKWDSRKLEQHGLGIEPEWLKNKRKEDSLKPKINSKWTQQEERLLISYLNIDKSKEEIANILNRSKSSIQRKTSRLKSKGLIHKNALIRWTKKENDFLLECDKKGMSDKEIAWELGREPYHIIDHRRNLRRKGIYKGHKYEFMKIKETKEMIEMLKKGNTKKEIAQVYNVHPQTITRRIKRYKEELIEQV